MTGDTQPTEPIPDPAAQWVLSSAAQPRRRRRTWPWLVAGAAVVILAVAAWIAGEHIARGILERTVRDQVVANLSVPADLPIDVDVPGSVLPQLIDGTIDRMTISADDVPLGELTGDVEVHATGVPVRGDAPIGAAHATVSLDQTQLQKLLATVDGLPAQSATLDAPAIAVQTDLHLFSLTVPVGVALVPSAAGGDLVLTPSALRVAGAEVSADAVSRQFGAIASTVVRDWKVCVAGYLPAGATLSDVAVERDAVVASFDVDGAITHDATLRERGTCD